MKLGERERERERERARKNEEFSVIKFSEILHKKRTWFFKLKIENS